MPGQYGGYAGAPGVGDTSAMPSIGLWGRVDAEMQRPGIWFGEFEDFVNYDATEASIPTTEDPFLNNFVFSSTGGLFTKVDAEGGVRTLGSDGDNEGSTVRSGTYPYKIIRDAGELVFEARISTTTVTDTKHGILVGLCEDTAFSATVPIAADGTKADINMVGFHRLEGDGDALDTVYKANGVTAVTVQSDAQVIAADTYYKLGMTFNRRRDNRLRFYINGLELTTTKEIPSAAGTDFPNDVRLGWFVAVLNATATTPGSANVDWVRVAQRRVTSVYP